MLIVVFHNRNYPATGNVVSILGKVFPTKSDVVPIKELFNNGDVILTMGDFVAKTVKLFLRWESCPNDRGSCLTKGDLDLLRKIRSGCVKNIIRSGSDIKIV